jgi:phosphoglycolate phosphatase-like HAD superfamily hydrolase
VTAARPVAIERIVWDWNGTLLDDAELVVAATSAAFTAAGHPPVSAQDYREHFVRPLQRFYGRLLDRPVSADEAAALDAAFHREFVAAAAEAAALRADAEAALRAAGLAQSLLSMWPHDGLVGLVGQLGLAAYFDRIDGNRDVGRAGKAEALGEHLTALRAAPGSTLVIGDTADDAAAAVASGCRYVLLDSGHGHPDALRASGPVVESLLAAVAVATGSAGAPSGGGGEAVP